MVSLDEMEERLRLLLNHCFDSAVVETQLLTRVWETAQKTLFFFFFFVFQGEKEGISKKHSSVPVCQCVSSPSMIISKV